MKIDEVPQDDANAFEQQVNVLQYALDEEGKYTTVKSVGWNPKTVVMQNAWEYEQSKIDEARQLVLQGKKSPIYYHMKKQMMDFKILAMYTGFWQLCVRQHCKPGKFKKLSTLKLQKYADAFGYQSIEQISNLDA